MTTKTSAVLHNKSLVSHGLVSRDSVMNDVAMVTIATTTGGTTATTTTSTTNGPVNHVTSLNTSSSGTTTACAANVGATSRRSRSKILLTISDDLSYTLEITGHTMAAVMAAVSMDDQLRQEWPLWHRFVADPHQFYVYVWDQDFDQYVRHRPSIPIGHLSRIKIRNRFYVNQSHRSLDDPLDAEPTDALFTTDSQAPTDVAIAPTATAPTEMVTTNNNDSKSFITPTPSTLSNQMSATLTAIQKHHNYHLTHPSLNTPTNSVTTPTPITTSSTITTTTSTATSNINSTSIRTISSGPLTTTSTITTKVMPSLARPTPIVLLPSMATKAAKKLFTSPSTTPTTTITGRLSVTTPVGPLSTTTGVWTAKVTEQFLITCAKYAKDLSAKGMSLVASDCDQQVWKQLAATFNLKVHGYACEAKPWHEFNAQECRDQFERLRLTYANLQCCQDDDDDDQDQSSESNTKIIPKWPFYNLMADICGYHPHPTKSTTTTVTPKLVGAVKRPAPAPAVPTTPTQVTPVYKSARIDAIMKARAASAAAAKAASGKRKANGKQQQTARAKLAKAVLANSAPGRLSSGQNRAQTNLGSSGLNVGSGGGNQVTIVGDGHGMVGQQSPGQPQEVSELYVALLNLVKKYLKYFEVEKKNKIWLRVEREMNAAGYKWNADSLRALFHRLRYNYLNILRTMTDEDKAAKSWPYYRYFAGLDLSAFSHRKHLTSTTTSPNDGPQPVKSAVNTGPVIDSTGCAIKRRPGRPRKQPPPPVLTDRTANNTNTGPNLSSLAASAGVADPNGTNDSQTTGQAVIGGVGVVGLDVTVRTCSNNNNTDMPSGSSDLDDEYVDDIDMSSEAKELMDDIKDTDDVEGRENTNTNSNTNNKTTGAVDHIIPCE